jgi:hypothetical protein
VDLLADAIEAYWAGRPPRGGELSIDLGVCVEPGGRLTTVPPDDSPPATRTAHTASVEHVREWVASLRSCGGFAVL